MSSHFVFFFFQAEDGIRDVAVTGVQTCALPISGFGAVPLGQAPTTDPQFYEPSRPNPYNEMVTVSFQHQLPRDMVLEVDYLGNWGRKLNTQTLEINQVPPALMGPGNAQ